MEETTLPTTIQTHSPEESIRLAKAIGARLRAGDVIAYAGGLGAGKTTFTRGIAIGMGLPDEVISPTFALVNEYRGKPGIPALYHFDMYRIASPELLDATGFYDYPLSESVFAIEWSENITDALPADCIRITIAYVDDTTRTITIEGDDRFADLGN